MAYFKKKLARKKREENPVRWYRKHLDFFPYWEEGVYWTGYFTSSPDYKLLFRESSRHI
jgi:hypothetical protein